MHILTLSPERPLHRSAIRFGRNVRLRLAQRILYKSDPDFPLDAPA